MLDLHQRTSPLQWLLIAVAQKWVATLVCDMKLDLKAKRITQDPLADISPWDTLNWHSRQILNDMSKVITFRKETVSEHRLFIVLSGVMAVRRELSDGRWTFSTLFKAGDIIDTERHERIHQGKLMALNSVDVMLVTSETFRQCLTTTPDINRVYSQVMRILAERARDHITDLACKTPTELVASVLFEFKRWPQSIQINKSDTVVLPISRRNIAHYLGIKPETISRVFNKLETQQLLQVPLADHVIMLDAPKIRQIANGGHPRGQG